MAEPTNLKRPHFQEIQLAFAAHLRNPDSHPAPADIESRRMQIYRDLFYNTVEGLISRAFPVLRKLSPDELWHSRVRDFYSRHRSQTPLFHEVAKEFLEYLETERGPHDDDPPFLLELAHYEWVESALIVADENLGSVRADPNGDPMTSPPVVSPLAWPLAYQWPVHRIGRDYQPESAPEAPTYLVVYRTRQFLVRFLEINPVTARLLQLIEEQPDHTGRQHLSEIAKELSHPDPEQVIQQGQQLFALLRESDVLLGTRQA